MITIKLQMIFILFTWIGLSIQQSINVNPLTLGTSYSGSLPVAASESAAYQIQLFSVFIPENTSSVTVTLENTYNPASSDCELIEAYISTDGYVPCSPNDITGYLCSGSYEFQSADSGGGEYSVEFTADDDYTGNYYWNVNQTWYFGISREYSEDWNFACSFKLSVSINSSCPTGKLGQPDDLDTANDLNCSVAYVTQNALTGTYQVSGSPGAQLLYKVVVPSTTVGNIHIVATLDSADASLYGRSFASPNDGAYGSACDLISYTSESNNKYIYDLYCYTPRIGNFYVALLSSGTFSGVLQINVTDCNSDVTGLGGVLCSYPVTNCASLLNQSKIVVQYNKTATYLTDSGPYQYCYVDITSTSNPSLNFSLTAGNDTNFDYYLIIRRDGFPEYSTDFGHEGSSITYTDLEANDHTSFALNNYDYLTLGRIYIGFGLWTNIAAVASSGTFLINGSVPISLTTSVLHTTGPAAVTTAVTHTTGPVVPTTSPIVTTHVAATGATGTTGPTGGATTGSNVNDGFMILPTFIFAFIGIIVVMI